MASSEARCQMLEKQLQQQGEVIQGLSTQLSEALSRSMQQSELLKNSEKNLDVALKNLDMLKNVAQKKDHDTKEWVEDDEQQQEPEPVIECIDREIQGSMELNNESEQLLTESEMEEEQKDAQSESITEDIPEPLSIPISFQLEVIFDETPIPYILHVKIDCDLTGFEKAKLLRLLKLMNLRRASTLCKDDVRNNWRDITFPFDRG